MKWGTACPGVALETGGGELAGPSMAQTDGGLGEPWVWLGRALFMVYGLPVDQLFLHLKKSMAKRRTWIVELRLRPTCLCIIFPLWLKNKNKKIPRLVSGED